MKKRLLSMLMAVLMIVSLVPAVALADTNTCNHQNVSEIVVEKNATASSLASLLRFAKIVAKL